MAWIDSHCHLDHAAFEHDLPQVLQQAQDAGITQYIVPGVGFHRWEAQQAIQHTYPNTHHAYGIHPWFCDLHTETHLEQLDDLLDHAIAVGECGLDFMPGKPKKERQIHWFETQLALAIKHDLPVIVHSVRAGDTVLACLKKHRGIRGVVHGFMGSLQQAEQLIKLGFLIGISTRLVHDSPKKTAQLAANLPLQHLLLETDAPDGMGKHVRNEPRELILVANIVAKLRQQTADEVLDTCTQNAKDLFQP